nr:hypothetical protein [Tanacetum cinerariifolium]
MVELLTMLFEACGAKFSIQGDLLDETNTDDVVVALVNMAAQDCPDYEVSHALSFVKIFTSLASFWESSI